MTGFSLDYISSARVLCPKIGYPIGVNFLGVAFIYDFRHFCHFLKTPTLANRYKVRIVQNAISNPRLFITKFKILEELIKPLIC